ncbi:MAG TPA: DNA recombination protein RmuC, partial [Terriglobales bacterium]|nr:DNA recombination protein RmuC [Terriglobales bacterium]
MGLLIASVVAFCGGMGITYLLLRSKWAVAEERIGSLQMRLAESQAAQQQVVNELAAKDAALLNATSELSAAAAALAKEREAAAEKLALVQKAQQSFFESFDLLAARALKENSAEFLKLAKNLFDQEQKMASGDLSAKKEAIETLLTTASDSIKQLEERIRSGETERKTTEAVLGGHIQSLVDLQHRLSDETRRLSRALERPTVRGNWGEVQLRRVVEFAGMIEHCHFESQKTFFGDNGHRLRPDLIIHMPNGRVIAVDAKVSLDAFTKAANADAETEIRRHLEQHAAQVRAHIEDLSSKAYWQ